ncbi:MAG: transcription elongation factor [Alphaproteobacteria bacterium]|nr:transcription elongation factor [Alphaproteobacteria bacterium]
MSRAFVKEVDDAPEALPERPVSANPNFVTAHGLRLIDATLEALRRDLAIAQAGADKAAIARHSRDLRYWLQRRTTAKRVDPPSPVETVAFATRVTLAREDGRRQRLAIVGEDEADPAKGTIAYTSPMARALMGRKAGEAVDAPGGEVEILGLEAVDPEG